MPVHRVLVTDVEARIAEIETTERIVEITAIGTSSLLVRTESKRVAPGETEKR